MLKTLSKDPTFSNFSVTEWSAASPKIVCLEEKVKELMKKKEKKKS